VGVRTIAISVDNDPDRIQTREQLGAALNTWRLRNGLTIRELARAADLPTATVGGYLTGRHLPGPSQRAQFAGLFEACGLSDPDELSRWQEALDRVRASTDGRQNRRGPDGAPYPGLRPFGPEDTSLFFGRDVFLAETLARLAALRDSDPGGPRLLFVVGASGSGKSSLLRAGVQPAVSDGALAGGGLDWSVGFMVPGAEPVAALKQVLATTEEPRLLIVDQFEELYTLANDTQATEFVAALADLGPRTLVAAGMRADFFPHAAADPLLVTALQDWQMVVPPLSEAELRAAIVDPAETRRVPVDEALVEVVLAEIAPSNRNALPLLAHALLAAWGHRTRGRLTLQHYRDAGGLGGAVQQSAEQAYGQLQPEQQDLARRLFLRLVTIDDEHVATKRRITPAELPDGDDTVRPVIERFVASRLITIDERRIEISHDALLTAWPRLTGWIAADRAGLLLHRRLTAAANTWRADGADDHLLLRGNLLSDVTEWALEPDHQAAMNTLEAEFLRHSVDAREADQRAARKRLSALRRYVAALLALFLISAGSAGYAFRASIVAAAQRKAANHARDDALSRQVAIESARTRDIDPALAEQLALAAYRISPTVDARSALLDAASGGVVNRVVGPSGPTMLRINPAGTVMAVSDAATGAVALRRYSADRPGEPLGTVPAADPGKLVFALAFNPDGDVLAVGGEAGRVRLYDVHDPAHPALLASPPGDFADAVETLAFSPDGTRLVAGGAKPALRAWSSVDGWRTGGPFTVAGASGTIQALAYSPDGRTLVAAGTTGAAQLWNADRLGDQPTDIPLGAATLNTIAWSPDGRTLVTGAKDGSVVIIDAADRTVRKTLDTGFTSWVNAAAYDAGGDLLAVGGSNNSVALFDARTYTRLRTIANAAQVTSLAYAPDGVLLHVASADGVIRSFPARSRAADAGPGPLFAIVTDRAGDRTAVASTGAGGHVVLLTATGASAVAVPSWFGASAGTVAISPDGRRVVTGNRAGTLLLTGDGAAARLSGATALAESVQFSPDGRLVAAASDDGYVHLWDVSEPAAPRTLPALSLSGEATAVAFSPDGRYLAAAGVDHKVHLWDIRDPRAAQALPSLGGFGNYAWSVAFSPDSRTLVAGGADDTVRRWDVTDARHSRSLGAPLTGPTHYVSGVAFSPDGHTLAASGGDGSVWTWRLTAGLPPATSTTLHAANPGGMTYAIVYSPDGRTLSAAGTSGVTMWSTDERAVAAAVCATGGDGLTASEWSQYVQGGPRLATCP
jgi:WD40 repeat protein